MLFVIGLSYFCLVLNTFRSWSGVSIGDNEPLTRLVQQSAGVGAGALGIASQEGTPLNPGRNIALPGVPEGSGSGGSLGKLGVHANRSHERQDLRAALAQTNTPQDTREERMRNLAGGTGSSGGGSVLGLELGQQRVTTSPGSGSGSKGKGRALPGGNEGVSTPQMRQTDLWGDITVPINPQPFKREEQVTDLDRPLPPPNSPPELAEFGSLIPMTGGLIAANPRTNTTESSPPIGQGPVGRAVGVNARPSDSGGDTGKGGVAEFQFGDAPASNTNKRGKKDKAKASTDEGKKGIGALLGIFK